MPTYKFEYFEEALDSVLGQTYPELELIICDDSEDGRIAALVEEKRASAAFPIRYHRNDTRWGNWAARPRASAWPRANTSSSCTMTMCCSPTASRRWWG